jgi:hypothetical protein
VAASGRPVETLVIQQAGGTRATIDAGREAVARLRAAAEQAPRVPMAVSELVVGTICGGSDGTSGITANPAVGRCFDMLVAQGATCIFEETGELIGCEQVMAARAVTPDELHRRGIVMAVARDDRGDGGLRALLDSTLRSLRVASPAGSSLSKDLVRAGWSDAGKEKQAAVIKQAFDDMMKPGTDGAFGVKEFQQGRKVDWDDRGKERVQSKL